MDTLRDPVKILHENRPLVDQILSALPIVKGQIRCVYQCGHCNQLFGRSFIPYGLGHGVTINPCNCFSSNNCDKMYLVQKCDP